MRTCGMDVHAGDLLPFLEAIVGRRSKGADEARALLARLAVPAAVKDQAPAAASTATADRTTGASARAVDGKAVSLAAPPSPTLSAASGAVRFVSHEELQQF